MIMRTLIHTGFLLVLSAGFLSGLGCDNAESEIAMTECEWAETLPKSRPADFNLLFRYGYGSISKNELNTFNGTFTKDMVSDPPVNIDFNVTDEDMDRIYRKMLEIDFFCYPDEFAVPLPESGTVSMVDPSQGYYFMVTCDRKVKVVRWEDKIMNENENATKLRALIRLIRGIIENRDEYRELPQPKGAYL